MHNILTYCFLAVKSGEFQHYTLNCSIGQILHGKSFPDGNATFRIAWSDFGNSAYNVIEEILPIVIKQGSSDGQCFVNFPKNMQVNINYCFTKPKNMQNITAYRNLYVIYI
jgi:hypothetical protein